MNDEEKTKLNRELENIRHSLKRLNKLTNKQRSSEKNETDSLKGGIKNE